VFLKFRVVRSSISLSTPVPHGGCIADTATAAATTKMFGIRNLDFQRKNEIITKQFLKTTK
jgi:hypothetical protein